MRKILKLKTNVAICGDFNIDLLNEINTKTFLNLLRTLNLYCTNNSPTRGTACLDNIIVNFSRDLYNISKVEECFADYVL